MRGERRLLDREGTTPRDSIPACSRLVRSRIGHMLDRFNPSNPPPAVCVVVPAVNPPTATPRTEVFEVVV
jgi:hypothetical protein